jgi:adenine-specific DNA-methyltransferase
MNESGGIGVFVQIGDENVHLVRCLMDEVFGSENFISMITVQKTTGAGSFSGGTNVLASLNDYIIWYSRSAENVKYRQLFVEKTIGGEGATLYTHLLFPDGTIRALSSEERRGAAPIPNGARSFGVGDLTSQTTRVGQTTVFPVEFEGKQYLPRTGGWKTNREGMGLLLAARRVAKAGNSIGYVRFVEDFPAFPLGKKVSRFSLKFGSSPALITPPSPPSPA